MSIKVNSRDLERLDNLGEAFVGALRKLPNKSASSTRNLVLDFYASEKDFIRIFQKKIDPTLSEPIAKSWEWAVNADTYWVYRNMSRQVIDHFDDKWTTSNLLIITRVMQCIGKWKQFTPEPSWEARIAEHIYLDGLKEGSSNSKSSFSRAAHRNPNLRQHQEHSSSQPLNTTRQLNTKLTNNAKQADTSTRSSASRPSNGLSLLLMLGLFIVGSGVGMLRNPNADDTTVPETEASAPTSTEAPAKLELLEQRYAQYKIDLANARLVCELDNVVYRFQSLASDASQQDAESLATQANQGRQDALSRIQKLKQPGEDEYWESCSEGVGFQRYDKYNWTYGDDFKGQFFAVAKKDCINPAIGLSVYADKALTKKLHSQWVTFSPNSESGIADKISFSVPARDLPKEEGSYIWWNHEVKCNHSG